MSLRMRILLLVLAATLLPVLVMTWLLAQNRAATVAEARTELVARTDLIAHDLQDDIAGTIQLLFGLARTSELNSANKPLCSTFLSEVLQEHPQYTGILTISPEGDLFCDSLQSGRKLNLADRDYFKRALQSRRAVVEPAIGRITGKAVLQIAFPAYGSDNRLKFVLLASLDMDKYGEGVATTLALPSMHFQAWNRDGTIVMDYPGRTGRRAPPSEQQSSFVLSGGDTRSIVIGSGKEALIIARTRLPGSLDTGLQLVLTVPEQDLKASIDGQFKHSLLILMAIAGIIFIGAAILAEYAVRRQAYRLMQGISRLDAGIYDQPIGAPYPRGEIGDVMRALDRMGGSLAAQHAAIAQHTDALERQARIDSLTGLANRHMLTYRLEQALAYARHNQRIVAVLMLDLDRFKNINDTLGHGKGDELLRETGQRLLGCIREDDTVARLGGDEFVVVLADMASTDDIPPIVQKILNCLTKPVALDGQHIIVSTSLGIALFPHDGETPDTLLRFADTAMYRAKEDGGNTYTFFTETMMQNMLERIQLERGLRQAVSNGELQLHFQPIVDAHSGRITSAEALLRWHRPEQGMISPAHFIPLAEETGLIIPIGEWVLQEACRQAREWHDEGLENIAIAVNLSARQFNQPDLDKAVAHALASSDCPAELLMLEITESSVMDHVEQALETMGRLTALGVRLMIDDFGTGYSSLSQLKRFPVSTLKIDASFVRDICADANDEAIVDAIITLAHKLGLRTVAEGVENQAQVDFLANRGCDKYQGYYFAKPCDASTFIHMAKTWPSKA